MVQLEALQQEINGICDRVVLIIDIVDHLAEYRTRHGRHLRCIEKVVDPCHIDDGSESRCSLL